MLQRTSLVLEGGGMRCAYTAGVLDCFLDMGLHFPLVSSASSGAVIGSSYVAKQRERNYLILQEIIKNPQFISFKRMVQGKDLFEMDFIFDTIPNQLVPFDFASFAKSGTVFIVGTTNIETGEAEHFDSFETKEELLTVIRASSSLPILAPAVSYQGKLLLDGGIADPIPISAVEEWHYKRHVVVLTRHRGYVKRASRLNWLYSRAFQAYPELRRLLRDRHLIYNRTMQKLREMEKEQKVFLLQPEVRMVGRRVERRTEVLLQLYEQGYREAEEKKDELLRFLQ